MYAPMDACCSGQAAATWRARLVSSAYAELRQHAELQGRLRAAVATLLHRTLAAAWRSWRECHSEGAVAVSRGTELQRRVLCRLQHQVRNLQLTAHWLVLWVFSVRCLVCSNKQIVKAGGHVTSMVAVYLRNLVIAVVCDIDVSILVHSLVPMQCDRTVLQI